MKTSLLEDIQKAADIVAAGGHVALPTETVYGLAADATNDRAVAKIFETKGRPSFNPLIIHVADRQMAAQFVEISELAGRLMEAFWPGPLTLVLPRRDGASVSLLASAGLATLAVRVPDHPIAQGVIKAAARPLAAPSANRSGAISPTTAAHVRDGLGERVDFIIDGGPCAVGLESTIIKIEGNHAQLLRPGGIDRREIEKTIGVALETPTGDAIQAPGMMTSHYAPNARLRLNATNPAENEAFLGFGDVSPAVPYSINLSERGDLVEAAAKLFACLHELDALCIANNLVGIAAAPIPKNGLGEAINDRLARASAPR